MVFTIPMLWHCRCSTKDIYMVSKHRRFDCRGFSLLEIMIVVGLVGVVAAIAVPMMSNSIGFYRLSGNARSAANAVALGKMRAASVFGRVRLFVDLNGGSFHLEVYDNKTTFTWVTDGGSTYLAQNVIFSSGVVATAPPNTQAVIGQAPPCKTNGTWNPVTSTYTVAPVDIANTACVIFNSRGLPIDSNGQPIVDGLYITDGTAVYAVTVSATGMVRSWRTPPVATPTWALQ
jgi:prepilin-type N-terminal cleavage/methylation domain-containing protein